MTKPGFNASHFEALFSQFCQRQPLVADMINGDLLAAAGLGEDEMIDSSMDFNYAFMSAPIDQLGIFSTQCGRSQNVFDQEVIDFLVDCSVIRLLVIADRSDAKIASASILIDDVDGEKFSALIARKGGSLAYRGINEMGYSSFESE
ncbi:MAG: hypothetical protein NTW50_01070 [Candidatus Berkelbacteria bacterium]|nr:hypothetical protein [Candidatus Berkelbacteria bacterium]